MRRGLDAQMRDLMPTSKAIAARTFGSRAQTRSTAGKWPLWASITLIVSLSVVLWSGLITLVMLIW